MKPIPPFIDKKSDYLRDVFDTENPKLCVEAVIRMMHTCEARSPPFSWWTEQYRDVARVVVDHGDTASKIFLFMTLLWRLHKCGEDDMYSRVKQNSPMERVDNWLANWEKKMVLFASGELSPAVKAYADVGVRKNKQKRTSGKTPQSGVQAATCAGSAGDTNQLSEHVLRAENLVFASLYDFVATVVCDYITA